MTSNLNICCILNGVWQPALPDGTTGSRWLPRSHRHCSRLGFETDSELLGGTQRCGQAISISTISPGSTTGPESRIETQRPDELYLLMILEADGFFLLKLVSRAFIPSRCSECRCSDPVDGDIPACTHLRVHAATVYGREFRLSISPVGTAPTPSRGACPDRWRWPATRPAGTWIWPGRRPRPGHAKRRRSHSRSGQFGPVARLAAEGQCVLEAFAGLIPVAYRVGQ